MSYIVLNLKNLTDLEIEERLRTLSAAQTNNPTAATGLTITPVMLTAAADLIQTKRTAQQAAAQAAQAATDEKDDAVADGEELIRDYAPDVWKGTGKNPAKCTLLGFEVRDGSEPPPPPPADGGQLTGLNLRFGANAGELVVRVKSLPRMKSIDVEVNLTPNAAPSWEHKTTVSSAPFTLTGLPSGSLVQVRVRAVFAGGVFGAWSDIAEHRVP